MFELLLTNRCIIFPFQLHLLLVVLGMFKLCGPGHVRAACGLLPYAVVVLGMFKLLCLGHVRAAGGSAAPASERSGGVGADRSDCGAF